MSSESMLYAMVSFLVVSGKEEDDMTMQSKEHYLPINAADETFEKFSTTAILTSSILTVLFMVTRIRLHCRFLKNSQQSEFNLSTSSSDYKHGKFGKTETVKYLSTMYSVKDDIGVAFGSTLPALVLFTICERMRESFDATTQAPHQMLEAVILRLYTALLSSIGVSFSASCFILTATEWIKTSAQQRSTDTEQLHMLSRKHSDCGHIQKMMLSLLIPLWSYIIHSVLQQKNGEATKTARTGEIGANMDMLSNVAWARFLAEITAVFISIESVLLFYYFNGPRPWKRTKRSQNSLQKVFSMGEWIVASSFLSTTATDYIFRYIHMSKTRSMDSDSDRIMKSIQPFAQGGNISSEMAVSQSGVLGCIVGVCIGNIVITLMPNFSKSLPNQNLIRNIVIQSFCTILFTVAQIQAALRQFCMELSTYVEEEWCARQSSSPALLPIQWLIWFLRQNEAKKSDHSFVPPPVNCIQTPRYVWLLYWCLILLISGPIAFYFAQMICNCDNEKHKKKLVVVSRKFFHLIAVALFTPVTAYAPKLMFLSYAIAIALLILVESLRVIVSSTIADTFEPGKPKDSNIKKSAYNQAAQTNQDRALGLNEFFKTFYDEKDKRATEGSFVVTHVALIAGCAMPLWMSGMPRRMPTSITPFLGIISLGIGDASGAFMGSFFGKNQWPTSRRTMEGSFAMLVTMIASGLFIAWALKFNENESFSFHDILSIYVPLTMLEAVTLQIDNMCLPIMAFVLSSA